jgi:hypothetical protein
LSVNIHWNGRVISHHSNLKTSHGVVKLRCVLDQRVNFIVVFELISRVFKICDLSFRQVFGDETPILLSNLVVDSWSGIGHIIVIIIFKKLGGSFLN